MTGVAYTVFTLIALEFTAAFAITHGTTATGCPCGLRNTFHFEPRKFETGAAYFFTFWLVRVTGTTVRIATTFAIMAGLITITVIITFFASCIAGQPIIIGYRPFTNLANFVNTGIIVDSNGRFFCRFRRCCRFRRTVRIIRNGIPSKSPTVIHIRTPVIDVTLAVPLTTGTGSRDLWRCCRFWTIVTRCRFRYCRTRCCCRTFNIRAILMIQTAPF